MAAPFDLGISDVTFVAGEDMSSNWQYHFVELQTAGQVHKADSGSATYSPIGILQNEPASGGIAVVRMLGCSKLVIDSTGASYGAWLRTDGSGRGVATTTGSTACAIALDNSDTSASSIIQVFFAPMSHLTLKA
jgi:hypothetical protein